MSKFNKIVKFGSWCVAVFMCLGFTGCSWLLEEPPALSLKRKMVGKHFVSPLSEQWKNVEIIDYAEKFTFPPPAGYSVMQYANYSDNVSLDIYREMIDVDDMFADIINRRRKADHCKLTIDEEMAQGLPKGMEMLAADGDCYVWHQGEFRHKYYFLRVGYVVFTFCLTSGVKEYDRNLKDFTNFVDYTVKDYLIYPTEERSSVQEYAYPINRQELISFLEPAIKVAKKTDNGK